jgi:zinc transport system substrate-binding protein
VAQTLAVDLGITIAVLDPVEGLTEDTEGEDYLSLMRVNLTALEEANGCT